MHASDTGVHPILIQIGHHHRDLQTSGEKHRQLARHEASAHNADLGDGSSQFLVGNTDRLLGSSLYQVERIQRSPQVFAHHQIGQRRIFCGESIDPVGGLGGLDKIQGPVRSWGCPVDACVDTGSIARDDLIPRFGVRSVPFNARPAGDDVIGPRE